MNTNDPAHDRAVARAVNSFIDPRKASPAMKKWTPDEHKKMKAKRRAKKAARRKNR